MTVVIYSAAMLRGICGFWIGAPVQVLVMNLLVQARPT
jgi:hypothetical protein